MTKSPAYIRALLDAHTLPRPEISDYMAEELVKDRLIEKTHYGYYTTTSRGAAYATLLEEVPLPEQKWIDPRKK